MPLDKNQANLLYPPLIGITIFLTLSGPVDADRSNRIDNKQ